MAVHREDRDLLAEALAAFLRGETGESAFAERVRPIEHELFESGEGDDGDALLGFCGQALFFWPGTKSADFSRQSWERYGRCLAFLDTDREYEPPKLDETRGLGPGVLDDVRKYRLHALGFLTSGVLVFFEGWWPLLWWWVASFLLLFVWGNVQDNRRWKEWLARNPPPPDFGPFRDEADWQANSWRLNRFRIPPFDPERYADLRPRAGWLTQVLGYTFGIAAILTLALVGVAALVAFWPLSVLSGCFERNEPAQGESSGDGAK